MIGFEKVFDAGIHLLLVCQKHSSLQLLKQLTIN